MKAGIIAAISPLWAASMSSVVDEPIRANETLRRIAFGLFTAAMNFSMLFIVESINAKLRVNATLNKALHFIRQFGVF